MVYLLLGGKMKVNYKIIQRLQNSPLTSWLWKYVHNDKTGEITIVPRFSRKEQK